MIGRYLQRHYNEILFGIFPTPPNPGGGFHKQIGIHDLYFGHSSVRAPSGKLGGMQQLPTPPVGLVRAELPRLVGAMCAPWIKHLTGLLVMAEDQPVYENSVLLDETASDRYGVPRLLISHRHTSRDKAAGAVLAGVAKRILRRAGALACYRHQVATFSHGVGTVRMGTDPFTSALDADCRFRGLDNLTVVDASVMPTSAAVNPSLTISAIALRAAERLVARASVTTASPMHVAAQPLASRSSAAAPRPAPIPACSPASAARSAATTPAATPSRPTSTTGSTGAPARSAPTRRRWPTQRVQAIVVATPPDSHLELTLAALEAGKHVVVEKPAFLRAADFDTGARRRGAERPPAHGGGELLLQAARPGAAGADRLRRAGRGALLPPGRGEEPAAGRLARRPRDRGRRRALRGRGALDRPAGQRRSGGGVGAGLPAGSRHRARAQHAGGGASTGSGGVGTLAHSWDVPSPLHGLRISRIYGTKGSVAFESNGIFVLVTGARAPAGLPRPPRHQRQPGDVDRLPGCDPHRPGAGHDRARGRSAGSS